MFLFQSPPPTQFDLNLGLMTSDIDVVVSGLDKQVYNAPVETDKYLIVSARI